MFALFMVPMFYNGQPKLVVSDHHLAAPAPQESESFQIAPKNLHIVVTYPMFLAYPMAATYPMVVAYPMVVTYPTVATRPMAVTYPMVETYPMVVSYRWL